jgi:uncharacterized protein YegL
MTSSPTPGINAVKSLFAGAVSTGQVGAEAADIMVNSLDDTNILGCTGVSADDLATDMVTLISLVMDSSYSMSGNESAVRDAYDELVIKAMKDSKQHPSMRVSGVVFDDNVRTLYGFKKVDDIGKIGSQYSARGNSTALYDATISAIAGIRAYAKNLRDSGVNSKCIVAIMTDGQNNSGKVLDADQVKTVVEDCLKAEQFYIAFIGFKSGPMDDYTSVAKAMGIPAANILTTTNSPSDVRKAMGLVSQSAIRKSQTQVSSTNTFFS